MKKGFLALLVSLALVFLLAPTEVSAAEGTALTSGGGYLSSGSYYLDSDVTLSTQNIYIYSGNTVTIDLNGHTLTGTGSGSVITVNGGNLTLIDSSTYQTGVLTGSKSSMYGGVFVVSGGSFTMSGGTISGNTATYGGGVSMFSGSFTMSGGTISGNTATDGGGVYVCIGRPFTVSGAPVISGNTNGNVCLSSGTYITLDGELTSGASIGVTTATTPTSDSAVQITATETYTTYYSSAVNYITSDNSSYTVQVNSAGYLELALPSITGSVSIPDDEEP